MKILVVIANLGMMCLWLFMFFTQGGTASLKDVAGLAAVVGVHVLTVYYVFRVAPHKDSANESTVYLINAAFKAKLRKVIRDNGGEPSTKP